MALSLSLRVLVALSFFHTVETFPSCSVETYTNLWHQCGCLSLGPVSAADDLPEGAGPPWEGAARPKVEAQSSCFFKVRAQTWNCSNFSTERTNTKSKTFCFYYLQDTIKFDWTCFTRWIISLSPFIYWSLCKMFLLSPAAGNGGCLPLRQTSVKSGRSTGEETGTLQCCGRGTSRPTPASTSGSWKESLSVRRRRCEKRVGCRIQCWTSICLLYGRSWRLLANWLYIQIWRWQEDTSGEYLKRNCLKLHVPMSLKAPNQSMGVNLQSKLVTWCFYVWPSRVSWSE